MRGCGRPGNPTTARRSANSRGAWSELQVRWVTGEAGALTGRWGDRAGPMLGGVWVGGGALRGRAGIGAGRGRRGCLVLGGVAEASPLHLPRSSRLNWTNRILHAYHSLHHYKYHTFLRLPGPGEPTHIPARITLGFCPSQAPGWTWRPGPRPIFPQTQESHSQPLSLRH